MPYPLTGATLLLQGLCTNTVVRFLDLKVSRSALRGALLETGRGAEGGLSVPAARRSGWWAETVSVSTLSTHGSTPISDGPDGGGWVENGGQECDFQSVPMNKHEPAPGGPLWSGKAISERSCACREQATWPHPLPDQGPAGCGRGIWNPACIDGELSSLSLPDLGQQPSGCRR